MISQTPEGWWVIDGDTHVSQWVRETKRLDHDQWLLQRLFRYVRPGDTVIDAGANLGDHTIAYLDWTGPKGKVHAFEPHPVAFECLTRNCPLAVCHPYGLSDAPRTLSLRQADANVGASFITQDAGQHEARLVALDSLDEIVKRPVHFIKVDIEGHEVEFLGGARHALERWAPVLCMEVNAGALARAGHAAVELLDCLRELGYRWEMLQPQEGPQYDVIARCD
jgi:FkbM family methyltransferase